MIHPALRLEPCMRTAYSSSPSSERRLDDTMCCSQWISEWLQTGEPLEEAGFLVCEVFEGKAEFFRDDGEFMAKTTLE